MTRDQILRETRRNPFSGKGKPEALKHNLKGWWSGRIDQEHRLVYKANEKVEAGHAPPRERAQ